MVVYGVSESGRADLHHLQYVVPSIPESNACIPFCYTNPFSIAWSAFLLLPTAVQVHSYELGSTFHSACTQVYSQRARLRSQLYIVELHVLTTLKTQACICRFFFYIKEMPILHRGR